MLSNSYRLFIKLIAKTWQNILTVLLPQVPHLAAISLFTRVYDASAGVVVGLVSTILGVVSVLGIGGAVVALRNITTCRQHHPGKQSLTQVLRAEFSAVLLVSVVSSSGALVVLLGVAHLLGPDKPLLLAYSLGAILLTLVEPINLAANGVLQAFNQDLRNAQAAMVQMVAKLGVLAVVLPLGLAAWLALLITAIGNGVVALIVLALRLRGIAGLAEVPLRDFVSPVKVAGPRNVMSQRFQAGSDGLVYMVTFFVASTVAAHHSPASGIVIATAVAIMRLLVVPIKQLGLVGGRLILQSPPGTITLRQMTGAATWLCLPVAFILLAWGMSPWSTIPWPMACLLAAQLLLEPAAGVLFNALKIVRGPTTGTALLFTIYWAGVIPALLLLSLTHWTTPTIIWLTLLAARLILATGSLRLALQK